MILSAMELRYAGIRNYVYFPDLYFLHLVKVTNPGLYDWTEKYLVRYFVTVSGELRYTDPEQDKLKKELRKRLEQYVSPEAASVTELGNGCPALWSLPTRFIWLLRKIHSEMNPRLRTSDSPVPQTGVITMRFPYRKMSYPRMNWITCCTGLGCRQNARCLLYRCWTTSGKSTSAISPGMIIF